MSVPPKLEDNVADSPNTRRQKQQCAETGSLGKRPSTFETLSVNPEFGSNGKTNQTVVEVEDSKNPNIRPSWKRFIILFLYCANSCNKNYQWIQIPATTTEATKYYGVSNYVINFCSALFMITFLVISTPACYLVGRIGLRKALILTSIGTTLGAIIKTQSLHEHGIYYVVAGSVFVSLSEQLIYSMPSKLAATWFPDDEVSTAVCVCFVGSQVGTALGFIVPPLFLDGAHTHEEIGQAFFKMFLYTTIISVSLLVLTFIFFDEAPKYAPGRARLKQLEAIEKAKLTGSNISKGVIREMIDLNKQCIKLLKSKNMVLMSFGYGIVMAIEFAMVTILDQAIEKHFPNDETIVGDTGFIMVLAGLVTLPICGRLMDATHKYKLINVVLTLLSTLSLAAFFGVIQFTTSKMAILLLAFAYGSFSLALLAAGVELAVEMTYPSPELVTSTLLNIIPHIFAVPFIYVSSYVVSEKGLLAANIFFTVAGVISLMCFVLSKEKLKRLEASKVDETSVIDRRLSRATVRLSIRR